MITGEIKNKVDQLWNTFWLSEVFANVSNKTGLEHMKPNIKRLTMGLRWPI